TFSGDDLGGAINQTTLSFDFSSGRTGTTPSATRSVTSIRCRSRLERNQEMRRRMFATISVGLNEETSILSLIMTHLPSPFFFARWVLESELPFSVCPCLTGLGSGFRSILF